MSRLEISVKETLPTQAVNGTNIVMERDDRDDIDSLAPIALTIGGSLDDEALQNMLSGLIGRGTHVELRSFLDMGVFGELNIDEQLKNDESGNCLADQGGQQISGDLENDFYQKYIKIDKSSDKQTFHQKLKHFLIFSVSGKPIYSFHGSDDLVIGYTGLITTIISLIEENLHEDIRSIDYEGLKIMILSKSPLILVSITKIPYEMALNQNTNENSILVNQLNVLYEYLLSILSKPVIGKLYHNRMNYDLRKSLTPLDFQNLDKLCLKLTYGLDTDPYNGLNHYLSSLLDNSRLTMKITYTTRSRLNSILLLLREKNDEYIFGFITYNEEIISLMKPKNHNLSYKDITNLLLLISNNQHQNVSEDLWIPVCLANFNSNGFLYCYVKPIDLSKYLAVDGNVVEPLNINIILLSTNKNNFYKMQEVCSKIIENLVETEKYRDTLYRELTDCHEFLKSPLVHYIYKDKATNQFISSKVDIDRNTLSKFIYYYTTLNTSKTTTIKSLTNDNQDKKLSYLNFGDCIGLMLSNKTYEFYCITFDSNLNGIIKDSLEVIRWCKRNTKRLFSGLVQYTF